MHWVAADMQGWRQDMEDEHIASTNVGDEPLDADTGWFFSWIDGSVSLKSRPLCFSHPPLPNSKGNCAIYPHPYVHWTPGYCFTATSLYCARGAMHRWAGFNLEDAGRNLSKALNAKPLGRWPQYAWTHGLLSFVSQPGTTNKMWVSFFVPFKTNQKKRGPATRDAPIGTHVAGHSIIRLSGS